MQRCNFDVRALLRRTWLFLVLALCPSLLQEAWARDEVRIPSQALQVQADLEKIFRHGRDLEAEKRWFDALSHYEEAQKQFPRRRELEDRVTLAQIHCDIARRYSDKSFQRLVTTLQPDQALEMYAEVLVKIQANYVDTPNWQDMLWRGTANLDVAVTKQQFIEFQIPRVTTEQVNSFRHELRGSINTRRVRGREDSRAVVAMCSHTAAQRLGLDPTAIILEYVCGAIAALDRYSSYLTGSQLDDIYSQIEGSFVGLGIEIKADGDSLLIMKTIPGGPAERAGIRAGDRIVEVGGQPTHSVSTEEAADMLKGEEGSSVRVAIMDTHSAIRRLSIQREQVDVPSVEDAQIIDRDYGIGYFRLANFQKTTSRDVDAALLKLQREGMRSLIIDVRGNPGGLLTASVEVADRFIPEGMLVSTRGRSPREDYDYKAHRVGTLRIPLVVLIDDETASASEIFAGAIRDHRRGEVIGQRSYGKGSVQGIFPLHAVRAGLRLTTAKFFSPSGRQISGQGVHPDVIVHNVAKPPGGHDYGFRDLEHDPVLSAAKESARRRLIANR